MSTDSNKELIRRGFEEGMNARAFNVFDQILAATFVHHSFPAPAPGPAGFRQVIDMFTTAFPDLHITIEDQIAEGDRVVTRGFFTGTQKGPFMNVPATGRSVKASFIDVWRIVDGKATENWVQMDLLGVMQQLGAIPSPG